MKKAKEDIETHLNKNNSRRAYKLMKDQTQEKQHRSTNIQDRSRKYLTEEQEILSRGGVGWGTEYCSELYNRESYGEHAVLKCSQP